MRQDAPGQAQPPRRSAAASGEAGAAGVGGRVRRSRSRVLTTAFELLSEGGVGSFTVDEVSRR